MTPQRVTTSLRIPQKLDESLRTMAEFRQITKTEMIVNILEWGLKQKQKDCQHPSGVMAVCASCGQNTKYVEYEDF